MISLKVLFLLLLALFVLAASPHLTTLYWTVGSTDIDGFHVWETPNQTGPFVLYATLPASAISLQLTGLSPGTRFYQVTAFNSGGDSVASNTVECFTPVKGGPTQPCTSF